MLTKTPQNKLSLLRVHDHFRDWKSLDDERLCLLCNHRFSGRDVKILTEGPDVRLLCPTLGCRSGIDQWVYPGNPLICESVYANWWRALGTLAEESPDEGTNSTART